MRGKPSRRAYRHGLPTKLKPTNPICISKAYPRRHRRQYKIRSEAQECKISFVSHSAQFLILTNASLIGWCKGWGRSLFPDSGGLVVSAGTDHIPVRRTTSLAFEVTPTSSGLTSRRPEPEVVVVVVVASPTTTATYRPRLSNIWTRWLSRSATNRLPWRSEHTPHG